MASLKSFWKVPSHQGVVKEQVGKGEGGEEGKLNGNYLKLIPGLCLEDRMN